jgi:hypothetical protein
LPYAAGGLRRPISPIKAITTPIAPAPQDMVPTVCAVRVDELEFRECYDGLLRGEDGWLKRQDAGQRRQRLGGRRGRCRMIRASRLRITVPATGSPCCGSISPTSRRIRSAKARCFS